MINNPLYQRQNFYFQNNSNPFYQQHPYHQHYRHNSNHQMYYHALPRLHQQNLNYQQNYYNYNRQFYPQFNSNNNNLFWNNQNYLYQYGYQFEPIQTHYSIHPLITNNQAKQNKNFNINANSNIKKNQNEMQTNKLTTNKTQFRISKSKSDEKKVKNLNNQRKFNDKSTATTPKGKNESNEEIKDFILKKNEDTSIIKIGDKYQEPSKIKKELEYVKPSNHEIYDSISSTSSINFNDLETSSEVFRQEGNDSTTIVNHIEIKLENSVDQKPKSTRSVFNDTIEELKSNNLFLAQQKKVEEYEQYEKVKKNELEDLHVKLKKEYKKNNKGERSNTKKRNPLFNLAEEENIGEKESESSVFYNKINVVNNDGKFSFKLNDELMDSNLGKIKFLGVYKANPENYFKNLSQKRRDKTLDSMVFLKK
jgi:hypothetical protein